jgi:hypothetical protein
MHEKSERRVRPVVAAALMSAVLAVSVAACSSGSSRPQVASLSGRGNAPAQSTGATATSAQFDRDFVEFARCLRQHGVDEPDPVHRPGHTGLSLEMPTPSPANRPALAACNHFLAGVEAMKAAGARTELARWLPSLIRYASCMRSHDIPMLDPGPQGQLNLGNVPGISSDFGRYSPQFRAADAACRHLLPHGVHDDGTGP